MVRKTFFTAFFMLLNLLTLTAHAADISAFVNRQNINVNESFNLVFEAEGSVDAEPDFSPLAVYFDILNQSQSSNMTIVNGNFSRKKVWTLALMAKQAGNYAIPSIEFGKDKSPVLNIKVGQSSASKSSSDSNLFLEVDVDQTSTYVQAQIIYTVKVFRSVEIQNASLTEPKLSDADAIVEKLGEDKRYQTTRNGVRFIVIERRYAIFPQQSGQLSIQPLEFNGQLVPQRRSFYDIAPFNGTSRRIQSKAVSIEVRPVPAAFKNKNWLPSSELRLVDEWPENASFKVGEPVTRTISVLASGLTAAQLPVLAQAPVEQIKQYPDQPSLNNHKDEKGITGIRQEKIAFIPTRAGSITLPEISIPWWNVKTGQLEYARIDAKNINVEAGASTQSAAVLPSTLTPLQSGDSISLVPANQDSLSVWFYTSVLLLLGWITSLVYLLPGKRKLSEQPLPVKQTGSNASTKNIARKFASACHHHNAPLCKSLLIEWANQQWPGEKMNSLAEVSLKLDSLFAQQVNILNQTLYSPSNEKWSADALLAAFQSYKGKPAADSSAAEPALKPISKML
ncbi:MAG: BatD family protein [Gammaproteobacteria bacterium]|nr:BatD family protein [Gammaproteobacteria bacterium]